MKILQINNYFYPKTSVELYYFNLCDALEDKGHEVVHFSMLHEKNRKSDYSDFFIRNVDEDLKKISSIFHTVYSLEAAEMVKRLVKKTRPDIAHIHGISYILTPAVLVSLRHLGVPVVQTLHDYQLVCPNGKLFTNGSPCERCKKHRYWNAALHGCVEKSGPASFTAFAEMVFNHLMINPYKFAISKFITPSEFLYAKMLEWGIDKPRLQYIPYYVDRQLEEKDALYNQIVFVGRPTQENGFDIFIDAMHEVQGCKAVIVTNDNVSSVLKEKINKIGIDCQIVSADSEQQLKSVIKKSSALIVPSLGYQSDLLITQYALAVGTPVIGSKTGGLPELINHGKNGYLFEPGNRTELASYIIEIMNNPLSGQLDNALSKAEHIDLLLKLYEDVQK